VRKEIKSEGRRKKQEKEEKYQQDREDKEHKLIGKAKGLSSKLGHNLRVGCPIPVT